MRQQANPHPTGNEWFNFAMLYLTDIHHPGLTILPTHRVLRGLSPAFVKQLPASLRDTCALEAFPCHTPSELEAQRQRLRHEMRRRAPNAHVFGLYTGGETLWLLTYHGSLAAPIPPATGESKASILDVSLLHDLLLEKVLGIDIQEDTIAFTQDDREALALVADQQYQVTFLLNPTRVDQIIQYAMAGKRMPRKSTYFYPKLLTGVVLHKEVSDADYVG
jgi:uncharacterized protein (DUF1015 family)